MSMGMLTLMARVCVDVLQAGEVRLIDFVEEVLAGEGEFDAVVAEDV